MLGMMMHDFNPSIWVAESDRSINSKLALNTEFQDNQGYIQRNPVSKLS